MLNNTIKFFLENKLVAALFGIGILLWGLSVMPFDIKQSIVPRDPVPVDAIPDIGENQQIVFTEWMGRSPQDVENQITYPLAVTLQGIPGVKSIRSYSAFGFSTIYIIFNEDVDFYWSRSRMLERLSSVVKDLSRQRALPDARLAYEHRVVLRPARQHLHHPADLVVPPDYGVQFPPAREVRQVARESGERLVLAFGVWVRHALGAAHVHQRLVYGVLVQALPSECRLHRAARLFGEADEDVFRADVFVLQAVGLLLGGLEHAAQALGDVDLLCARDGRYPAQCILRCRRHYGRFDPQLLQHGRHYTLRLLQESRHDMLRQQLGMPPLRRNRLRPLQRLLTLNG